MNNCWRRWIITRITGVCLSLRLSVLQAEFEDPLHLGLNIAHLFSQNIGLLKYAFFFIVIIPPPGRKQQRTK
jgi:hypothetical protein